MLMRNIIADFLDSSKTVCVLGIYLSLNVPSMHVYKFFISVCFHT